MRFGGAVSRLYRNGEALPGMDRRWRGRHPLDGEHLAHDRGAPSRTGTMGVVVVVDDPRPSARGAGVTRPALATPLAHPPPMAEAGLVQAHRIGQAGPIIHRRAVVAVAAGEIVVRARAAAEQAVVLGRVFGREAGAVAQHDDAAGAGHRRDAIGMGGASIDLAAGARADVVVLMNRGAYPPCAVAAVGHGAGAKRVLIPGRDPLVGDATAHVGLERKNADVATARPAAALGAVGVVEAHADASWRIIGAERRARLERRRCAVRGKLLRQGQMTMQRAEGELIVVDQAMGEAPSPRQTALDHPPGSRSGQAQADREERRLGGRRRKRRREPIETLLVADRFHTEGFDPHPGTGDRLKGLAGADMTEKHERIRLKLRGPIGRERVEPEGHPNPRGHLGKKGPMTLRLDPHQSLAPCRGGKRARRSGKPPIRRASGKRRKLRMPERSEVRARVKADLGGDRRPAFHVPNHPVRAVGETGREQEQSSTPDAHTPPNKRGQLFYPCKPVSASQASGRRARGKTG